MSTNSEFTFSSDRPLTEGRDDRLNRGPFAERIAGVLLSLPKGSSLTIGIHGPWGDGKTTVLNIIRAKLEASAETVVVELNPWRFTEESVMLAEFFRDLAASIRAKLTTKGEDIARWIERAGRYASIASDRIETLSKVASEDAEAGLEKVRRRLFEALAQADKRIVVLVDDIDRLDKHESHTLFRLVKACADFPNVCYVLAFDDVAVAKAIGERYGGGDEAAGRAFLEKIIQIPLKLPVAAKEDLRSLCFEQVDGALRMAGIELTQEEVGEFVAGFDRGPSIRLTTPRGAKRYGNGLMFALPMLKGEVNSVDLLLVEALRAFFPEVYDLVREEHTAFSGTEQKRLGRVDETPRSVVLLTPILDAMPGNQAAAAKALLIDLFPRLSGPFGHSAYDTGWLSRWNRERRVSSPEYCPRYFTYAIPRDDVPDAAVAALLQSAASQKESDVVEVFETYLSVQRAGRFIEKLRTVEETVDPTAAEVLAFTLATHARSLPTRPAFFDFAEPPAQAAILISHLLRRLPADRRPAAAKRIVAAADPLWFAADCVRWFHLTDKPEKHDSNTLTREQNAEVRRILVERIKALAATGELLFNPEVPEQTPLLFEWRRAEGQGPVQAYLESMFAKDARQVARFLQTIAPRAWRSGSVLPRVAELRADQLKTIKLVIDLDTMANLIREHLPGDFDNPQVYHGDTIPLERQLAEQFMAVYNNWKASGEPPDVPNTAYDAPSAATADEVGTQELTDQPNE